MSRKLKTEHAGAKNGGGHWGPRHEAKNLAKKLRRLRNKLLIKKEVSQLSKNRSFVESD
jgi:hypothetical protein